MLNVIGLEVTSRRQPRVRRGRRRAQAPAARRVPPGRRLPGRRRVRGADFTYLAANVVDKRTGLPILPPFDIRIVDGVPVGFVGHDARGHRRASSTRPASRTSTSTTRSRPRTSTPTLLRLLGRQVAWCCSSTRAARRAPHAAAGPDGCAELRRRRSSPSWPASARSTAWSSPGTPTASTPARCPNSAGTDAWSPAPAPTASWSPTSASRWTSGPAGSSRSSARNVIVENGVRNPDGTWQTDADRRVRAQPGPGRPGAKKIADKYRTAVAPIANRVVGSITADITRDAGASRREPARRRDRRRAARPTRTADGAQIALMNPGGIRAVAVVRRTPPAARRPARSRTARRSPSSRSTTWWSPRRSPARSSRTCWSSSSPAYNGQTTQRILQVSAGLHLLLQQHGAGRLPGSANLALNGTPIDPAATYRVTTNDFLANGGDGFTNLTARHRPRHRARLRRRRAGRLPGRRRPGRAGPGQPHHPARLNRRVRRLASR